MGLQLATAFAVPSWMSFDTIAQALESLPKEDTGVLGEGLRVVFEGTDGVVNDPREVVRSCKLVGKPRRGIARKRAAGNEAGDTRPITLGQVLVKGGTLFFQPGRKIGQPSSVGGQCAQAILDTRAISPDDVIASMHRCSPDACHRTLVRTLRPAQT